MEEARRVNCATGGQRGLELGGRSCSYRREKPLPEMLCPCREVAQKKYSGFSLLLPSGLLLGFPLAEARAMKLREAVHRSSLPGAQNVERRAE